MPEPADELIDIYDKDRRRTGLIIPREGARLEQGQFMLYTLALIEDRSGRFLITQRALDKHWAAGSWEVTGGGVRAGETPQQTVVREVAEEVGLDVAGQPLTPVYSYVNEDLASGDNYFMDIFHFRLDFGPADVSLQQSEAIDFALATWDGITKLEEQGKFLHYRRLAQALAAEAQAAGAQR